MMFVVMPSIIAIISKTVFESHHSGTLASPGDLMPIDCYRSKSRHLEGLSEDGDLYLVTVRPNDVLWLVAILERPHLEEDGWTVEQPNKAPITDISTLFGRIRLESGKGINARPGALGMSLQTPRTLAKSDETLLREAAEKQPRSSRVWDEDSPYRSHTIEPATTGRSICQTCHEPIPKAMLRLAEAFSSQYRPDTASRFHHLACAATHHPYKLRQALAASSVTIPQREELEQTIASALDNVDDLAARDDETAREYNKFVELVLSRGADSESILVFADWLQSVGDPRGELIIVQAQRAAAKLEDWARFDRRERELLAANRKQFIPQSLQGEVTWDHGFIKRLVITERTSLVRSLLASIFAHSSMLLLDELVVDRPGYDLLIAANLPPVPRSVTTLRLHATLGENALGNVSQLVATAPALRVLSLKGVADLDALAHPLLEQLEVETGNATEPLEHAPNQPPMALTERLELLRSSALPSLRRLVLRTESGADAVCNALASSNLLPQLRHLSLPGGMTPRGAELIARRLAGEPKLETLDMSLNEGVPSGIFDCLRDVCEQLIARDELPEPEETASPPDIEDWLVRHTRKPEWGIGRVVEEHDGGHLEVEFEQAGIKIIRNTELLEDL